MGTLVAQPNNNDVDAAFKDHLLAVLSLHDAPRAAAAPIPRYSGPADWQTEAILRKVEALLRDSSTSSGAAAITTPTPTPKATMNGMGSVSGKRPPTPVLAGLPPVPANLQLHSNGSTTKGRGSPDSEASYNTALEDDVESTDTTTNWPSVHTTPPPRTADPRILLVPPTDTTPPRERTAQRPPRCAPTPTPTPYPVYARTNPNGTDADFSDGGHTPGSTNGEYPPPPYPYPYTESPGVVPTGGALASAATQGGMDALEELRLLKDQVRDVSRVCNAVATGTSPKRLRCRCRGI
ncbi:hypothetical protein B0H16DRAFT_119083 [Mycena metata]|uniref:Uncharacterized protein n=1 Tax=Mycena metata TaxID=1033252 RepID=A0AAD7MYR8_9AGAR|nr:hypothetical protein B0H16DRAFT_119083 [Mycena metata]